MELNVRLSAKDVNTQGVFDALKKLCLCFKPQDGDRNFTMHPPKEDAPAAPAVEATTLQAASAPRVPIQAPQNTVTAPPVSAHAIPTAPPTAAMQTFTTQQAAQAAAIYAETSDAARNQVVELIHSFGVNALNELPQDKLGAFVTNLRGLGARI